MKTTVILGSLARAARWHRRKLAMLAAIGCVAAFLAALSPTAPDSVELVVANKALRGGDRLAASDLRVISAPPDLAPDGALSDPQQLAGRVLAAPVPRGAPVTEVDVVGSRAATGKDELLVPVPIAQAQVLAMVQVGDRVTVVAPGGEGNPVTLASRVRVTSITRGDDQTDGVLLVACDQKTGARLAAWSTSGSLGIALG